MDISKLNLILDIAETKNLTLSAEHMGYTQSGVSHAIHKLEAEMGISLLNRTNKGVELTVEGELLLPYIRTISANYKRMDDILDSIHGLQRGSICIGTYSSVAAQWLPHVLKNSGKPTLIFPLPSEREESRKSNSGFRRVPLILDF